MPNLNDLNGAQVALGVFSILLIYVVPALISWVIARRTIPSARAQEQRIAAETDRVIAETNREIQDQLRQQIADLTSRVEYLEASVQSADKARVQIAKALAQEQQKREELEIRLEQVHAWAKALESQVIELGVTPIPFSRFA